LTQIKCRGGMGLSSICAWGLYSTDVRHTLDEEKNSLKSKSIPSKRA
jgi:hypothetical protein